jgi:hypothetical protein
LDEENDREGQQNAAMQRRGQAQRQGGLTSQQNLTVQNDRIQEQGADTSKQRAPELALGFLERSHMALVDAAGQERVRFHCDTNAKDVRKDLRKGIEQPWRQPTSPRSRLLESEQIRNK